MSWLIAVENRSELLQAVRRSGYEVCVAKNVRQLRRQMLVHDGETAFVCGTDNSRKDLLNILMEWCGFAAIIVRNTADAQVADILVSLEIEEPEGAAGWTKQCEYEEMMIRSLLCKFAEQWPGPVNIQVASEPDE